MEEIAFEDPISDENEMVVLRTIEAACKEALSQYPTSEEEDTALMNDASMFNLLPKNSRMAIKHRRNEKRILKNTIAAVQSQQERLGVALGL